MEKKNHPSQKNSDRLVSSAKRAVTLLTDGIKCAASRRQDLLRCELSPGSDRM